MFQNSPISAGKISKSLLLHQTTDITPGPTGFHLGITDKKMFKPDYVPTRIFSAKP